MDIFISYRRDGGRDMARAIQLALKAAGYSDVFFDFNSLRDGVFNEQIIDAINECKDFLLILSKGSMDRCANEGDWVRREIKSAIDAGCKIIPVLVESEWNWPESFPKALNIIKSIQFTKVLNDEYFDDYMKRLIERLDSLPNTKKEIPIYSIKTTETFLLKLSVDETAEILINNERVRKVKAGKTCVIDFLERGKTYSISVCSLAIRKDSITFEVTIPMFSNELEKSVSFLKMREERTTFEEKEKEKRKKALMEKRVAEYSKRELLKHYDYVDIESEKTCVVGRKEKGIVKYGLVDENGLEIIPCVYDDAVRMNEGLAAFCSGGIWSYFDKEGFVVLENTSEVPGRFIKGLLVVCQKGYYGLVNEKGDYIIPCDCESIVMHLESAFLFVRRNDKEVFLYYPIDNKLKRVAFDNINVTDEEISVCKCTIPYIDTCYDSCYLVKKGDMFGILDKEGTVLVRCVAQELKSFMYPNLFKIKIHDKYGIYDVENKVFSVPTKYSVLFSSNNFSRFYYFSHYYMEQYIVVSEKGKNCDLMKKDVFGVVDMKGNVLIPMEYAFIVFHYNSAICFKRVSFKHAGVEENIEPTEYDEGSMIYEYGDWYWRCCDLYEHFIEERPFESSLECARIEAVVFNSPFLVGYGPKCEGEEWIPNHKIVYEGGQYFKCKMDGTPIVEKQKTEMVEDNVSDLLGQGFVQYKSPKRYFRSDDSCEIVFMDGSNRFFLISENNLYGLADVVSGLIIIPPCYRQIDNGSYYWTNDDSNMIEIRVSLNDSYQMDIRIKVLQDSSVWIKNADYRYSENKKEELFHEYFSFLYIE